MIKKQDFIELISQGDFLQLFVTELGWNRYRGQAALAPIAVDGDDYQFTAIAERNGFQILTCPVTAIPTTAICRKIDAKLRRQANDYIAIFMLRGSQHHLWAVPVRSMEKRDLVMVEYETPQQADLLYSKVDGFSFELGEDTTIVDLRERVQGAFAVNSEKITKDFYTGFKREHAAFARFISGIDDQLPDGDNKNKQWYTSIMLNRLMFCYFIQKKGFLDLDFDYLRHKLEWVRREQGEDRFFSSFYRGFLVSLFHDGLNAPQHSRQFLAAYGRIPYLNGGMFDTHQLEEQYRDIDIADEAFSRLFDFFDTWQWHLDTRITASGRDINPDVLGYIFEQYINDRAQMGAYYTKEDITEYIGRNCILPFLLDRVGQLCPAAFAPADGVVWSMLRQSGTRYIFDAVKRGYDRRGDIPADVAQGIITPAMRRRYCSTPVAQLPAGHTPLAQLRAKWNTPTPEPWALPTEIWRETIERLQRCAAIEQKIASGEIASINDFITYNLDIRLFATDLLARADRNLIKHFYSALQQVTILDPTCGSGAFLFAAMNILEPLYEACIARMQEEPSYFKKELDEISNKYRSNIQYFIYKSIILRNLYGVDIMAEATEIAKLRLFLKMVAVVDVDGRQPNLGLDPLPDIDFNIRCGNTLVGYANEQQLDTDLKFATDILQELANQEFREKINAEMRVVSMTFKAFKRLQLEQEINPVEFKQVKVQLRQRLAELNRSLNHRLYTATHTGADPENISDTPQYIQWKQSHQPFHWLAEFYEIIQGNGGFDVIIGNPPYVEYNKKDKATKKAVSDIYRIKGYSTESCGNLYAYVLERCKSIMKTMTYMGMIVPLSGHSTERMQPLVANFYRSFGLHLHLNLSADANPQRLFEGVKFRLCIFFVSNSHSGSYSSKYTRWLAGERKILFSSHVVFNDEQDYSYNNIIGKIPSPLYISIAKKVNSQKTFFYMFTGTNSCLYHNVPVNWIRSHSFVPYFKSERDGEGVTTQLKQIDFDTSERMKIASCIINSSLFFIWWLVNSDCYHLNKPEIANLKYTESSEDEQKLVELADILQKDMLKNSCRRVYNYKTSGRVEYDEFYMKLSKPIIDEIDRVLAEHYGFTEEELDFIINYDIKYRMGDELNE